MNGRRRDWVKTFAWLGIAAVGVAFWAGAWTALVWALWGIR